MSDHLPGVNLKQKHSCRKSVQNVHAVVSHTLLQKLHLEHGKVSGLVSWIMFAGHAICEPLDSEREALFMAGTAKTNLTKVSACTNP